MACEPDFAHWQASLQQRAALPAAAHRAPLTLAQTFARIGSVEPALAESLAQAGLPLRQSGVEWQVAAPADASLAAIARWLHRNGLGGHWRDELLDVNDDAGTPVAVIERAAVRALGITTFAVHLVGACRDGRVWVQQRAFDKATDPGLWDTTMGGQVGAGESPADTLERETWEEAGLRLAQLQGLGFVERIAVRRPVPEGYMDELIDVYEATVPDGVVPVNQDGEVHRFESLPPAELVSRLRANAFTLEAALILSAWLLERGTTLR